MDVWGFPSERDWFLGANPTGTYLNIAREHVKVVDDLAGALGEFQRRREAAYVATVFSAAAVESAVNKFITYPILSVEGIEMQKFYGPLITQYLRTPLRDRVRFVAEFTPAIDKKLCARVVKLAAHRNVILHTVPEFGTDVGIAGRMEGTHGLRRGAGGVGEGGCDSESRLGGRSRP